MQHIPHLEKFHMTIQLVEKQAALDERVRCKAIMDAGVSAGKPSLALSLMETDITAQEAFAVLDTSGFGQRMLANSPRGFDEVAWQRNMKVALARINKTI